MSLKMGKSFDRIYNLQVPFQDSNYDIGIFFNKRNSFVLFSADSNLKNTYNNSAPKINMFKNLESSKFCETFIKLHQYKGPNLDILNQFHNIKPEYQSDVNFIFNETINLAKIDVNNRTFYEKLTVYGFTMTNAVDDYIFLISERQNIVRKLNKKIVRTTGIQIATSETIQLLNEYHNELKDFKKTKNISVINTDVTTKIV